MRKRIHRASGLLPALLLSLLLPAAPATAGPPKPATAQEIRELLASAGDAKDYADASVVIVLDEADVYVEESGLATTESCRVVKILTDEGVKAHAVLRESFDPDTYRVAFRSVIVHRADGRLEAVPLWRMVTQPTTQGSIFWGGEQHLLPVPRLNVGDALEIRVSRIGFNIAYLNDGPTSAGGAAGAGAQLDPTGLEPPMAGHWFEVTPFHSTHPTIYKRYSVHAPIDMPIQYGVYNGGLQASLWLDGDTRIYTFTAENIVPAPSEEHMVAASDCQPKVVMATVPDWETKSIWFHEVNEPQFDADDAIRAKVAEITAGLEDEEAKIRACLHWVADYVRYYGTSRGPREGFTLHKSTETFRDLGGVCKDKAGMLVTMLRVLGHEAYPSLTMAGSRVERIPADQFNHTVTVMRNPDGTFRVLDPTWSPTSKELWSSREALQGLVYGTPEGEDLTLSPYFSPEENLLQLHATSRLAPDGSLSADVRADMTGYPCTYLRRGVNGQPRPEQKGRLERELAVAPNAVLATIDHIAPRDYSRDGWLEMTLTAPRYAMTGESTAAFRLPMMRHPLGPTLIPDLFYDFSADERRFGLKLRATRLLRYEETITLPDGWRIASVPEARSFESPSASLDFEIISRDGELTYRFELAVRDHIIAPENYAGFKKAIDMMNEIADAWVVCTAD